MAIYQLPEFKLPKFKLPKLLHSPHKSFSFPNIVKKKGVIFAFIVLSSFIFGFLGGITGAALFPFNFQEGGVVERVREKIIKESSIAPLISKEYIISSDERIIEMVKKTSPSVVSIVVSKDVPKYKKYYINPFEEIEPFFGPFNYKIPQYKQEGTKKETVAHGTGFIISKEGMILTNAHVVSEKNGEYSVFTNDGKEFSAKVLARDSLRDIAILKIEKKNSYFKPLKLGDSSKIEVGQTVIAIGNALGEYRNTVSKGVISGLGRKVTASGGGVIETLENVIQTDAAINPGNSGGPLLNLDGEVIGVNFAMAKAENIGFAIPINGVKKDIEQVKAGKKITYPFLGVRYVIIDKEIQEQNNLPVDYGAYIIRGSNGEPAIIPGSAAEEYGLKEGDIILELEGVKINLKNPLSQLIIKHNPGDEINLKILRGKKEINIKVVLGKRSG